MQILEQLPTPADEAMAGPLVVAPTTVVMVVPATMMMMVPATMMMVPATMMVMVTLCLSRACGPGEERAGHRKSADGVRREQCSRREYAGQNLSQNPA
jgi:hypothetical protein